ncbi:MAG: hypothetical protein AMXMBFR4_17080 [Candidatus Hydrogenedentota bacterium]
MNEKPKNDHDAIPAPPRGLAAIMMIGPGLVWCGEYIGSGEVILATRNGAIFGVAILWAPFLAIFAKYWIGLAGAHYTVTTGEGMIDMLSRTPVRAIGSSGLSLSANCVPARSPQPPWLLRQGPSHRALCHCRSTNSVG